MRFSGLPACSSTLGWLIPFGCHTSAKCTSQPPPSIFRSPDYQIFKGSLPSAGSGSGFQATGARSASLTKETSQRHAVARKELVHEIENPPSIRPTCRSHEPAHTHQSASFVIV